LVLGRLIEAASGRSYYDLLQERILDRQKLDDIHPQNVSVLSNIVPGYIAGARNLKKDGRMKFDPRTEWTGGGLVTTPTMLAKFYGALAEGRVVQPESLALMLKGDWQNPQEPCWRYGYGLFVYDNGKIFGHGGKWAGYRTHVTHYASTGLTIAVQTNRDGRMELERLVGRIAAAARIPVGAIHSRRNQ
jgi:D-alanyl-D-alanine carboxypeptidase